MLEREVSEANDTGHGAELQPAMLQELKALSPAGNGFVLQVLGRVDQALGELPQALAHLCERDDLREVTRAVHSLKSSSAYVGALRFSRQCGEVVDLLRARAAERGEPATGVLTQPDVAQQLRLLLQRVPQVRAAIQAEALRWGAA